MTVLSMKSGRPARGFGKLGFAPEAAPVVLPALAMLALGVAMILSASWVSSVDQGRSPYFFLSRQAIGVGIGLVLLFGCARLSITWIKRMGRGLAVASLVGLVTVFTPLGAQAFGSRRWIEVAGITIQPSEFAKLAFVMLGAELCARQGDRLKTVGQALRPLGLLFAAFAVPIMLQPDLGTTTLLGLLYMGLLWTAGTPVRTMATMSAVGVASFWALAMSAPYRRARVMSFLDPFADPEHTGYQAVQSIVALGSGGLFGAGIGMSRQKWLYVPNAHTDFIYAIIGEELGLVGTLAILGAFGLFAWGGYRIAQAATDPFCRMLAAGITIWIVGQAIVNIGAVTSVLPITGVPLPFISYGNSAVAVTLAGVGLLAAVARHTARTKEASTPA